MRDEHRQADAESQLSRSGPASVRVLVGLGINPYSQRLLQTAARLADGLDGELLALHIAPPGRVARLYEANLEWQLEQARGLGAQVAIIEGSDVAATLIRYAQAQRVTHLVVGQSDVTRWREITRGSVINRMLRMILSEQNPIDLYIVTASSRGE